MNDNKRPIWSAFLLPSFLVLIAWCLNPEASPECSCQDPGTVEEAFLETPFIIHGKVLSQTFAHYKSAMNDSGAAILSARFQQDTQKLLLLETQMLVKTELKVLEKFKGNIQTDTITVYTTRTSGSCGYRGFIPGAEYIVYASGKSYAFWPFTEGAKDIHLEKENTYWTNQCTRTSAYEKSEAKALKRISRQ